MTFKDPIVAEVREVRERLMAEAGVFDEYVRKLKSLESDDAERLVTQFAKHDKLPEVTLCAEDKAEYKGER